MDYQSEIPEKWEYFTLKNGLQRRKITNEYKDWLEQVWKEEFIPYFNKHILPQQTWRKKPKLKEFCAFMKEEYKHKVDTSAVALVVEASEYIHQSSYGTLERYYKENPDTHDINDKIVYFWPHIKSYEELHDVMIASGAMPEGTKQDATRARVQHLIKKGVLKDIYLPWRRK